MKSRSLAKPSSRTAVGHSPGAQWTPKSFLENKSTMVIIIPFDPWPHVTCVKLHGYSGVILHNLMIYDVLFFFLWLTLLGWYFMAIAWAQSVCRWSARLGLIDFLQNRTAALHRREHHLQRSSSTGESKAFFLENVPETSAFKGKTFGFNMF